MTKPVRLVLGSEKSDKGKANIMLAIFHEVGLQCEVSVLSCDRDTGDGFQPMVESFNEPLIAYLGGMDLAAPAIVGAILNNAGRFDQLVFAVPTDKAARSAIENRPIGNPIMTCGLNETSVRHSISNSALAIAKLAGMLGDPNILEGLREWHEKFRAGKPMKESLILVEGLIP